MEISDINKIAESSKELNDMCLSLLGASLIAILSTSYVKPVNKYWRLMYLLFLPAWAMILLSIHKFLDVNGRQLLANVKPERIPFVFEQINDSYYDQINYFYFAIICFVIWLTVYLIWFIFADKQINQA